MILITYSFGKVAIGILFVSLAVLVLIIAYRKLLNYLGKGNPVKEDYCVLYGLEVAEVIGEVEFYFTTEAPRTVRFELLNEDMTFNRVIREGDFGKGGHIVRFETKEIENGNYFYCLKTDNQKTMKKMKVNNP